MDHSVLKSIESLCVKKFCPSTVSIIELLSEKNQAQYTDCNEYVLIFLPIAAQYIYSLGSASESVSDATYIYTCKLSCVCRNM